MNSNNYRNSDNLKKFKEIYFLNNLRELKFEKNSWNAKKESLFQFWVSRELEDAAHGDAKKVNLANSER